MKSIEKLEAMVEKKRAVIEAKQRSLKKDIENLKSMENEIKMLKGEVFRKDVSKLDLSAEEYDQLRKYVLSSRSSLLEVINLLADEGQKKEGEKLE